MSIGKLKIILAALQCNRSNEQKTSALKHDPHRTRLTSQMELTVMFQGDDDFEELIYSGGTRETWSWLPSKG